MALFQERYKDRMSVVEKMRNETQYLITLVKQLTPFIHNYKAVSDKLHPKLGTSSSSGPDGQSLDNMNQVRGLIGHFLVTCFPLFELEFLIVNILLIY